jgi:hypothetical protein
VTTRKKALAASGLGLYLVGFGILTGMVFERMRFDRERAAVLTRYEAALHSWQAYRMALEKAEAPAHP